MKKRVHISNKFIVFTVTKFTEAAKRGVKYAEKVKSLTLI